MSQTYNKYKKPRIQITRFELSTQLTICSTNPDPDYNSSTRNITTNTISTMGPIRFSRSFAEVLTSRTVSIAFSVESKNSQVRTTSLAASTPQLCSAFSNVETLHNIARLSSVGTSLRSSFSTSIKQSSWSVDNSLLSITDSTGRASLVVLQE